MTFRRRHVVAHVARAVLVFAVLLVALAIRIKRGDGEDGDTRRREPPPVTRTSSTTSSSTTTTLPPLDVADVPQAAPLATALPASAGAGFADVAPGTAGVGVLDLERAAAAEADVAAERSLLETRRFVAGFGRAWTRAAGPATDRAYAAAYEFSTPADATAYKADGAEAVLARGAQPFPVDVAGADGFSQVTEPSGARPAQVTHAVTLTRGARFFLVFVSRSGGGGLDPEEARALARATSATAAASGGAG